MKLYKSLMTSFCNVSLIACVYLYVGFFSRSVECCLLWQRPVEAVVPFEDADFSEVQSALKKIMPVTP